MSEPRDESTSNGDKGCAAAFSTSLGPALTSSPTSALVSCSVNAVGGRTFAGFGDGGTGSLPA